MWRTELLSTSIPAKLMTFLYLSFAILLIFSLYHTYLDDFSSILLILLTIEWSHRVYSCRFLKGELALFYDNNELYWAKQRWYICGKPLLFSWLVIIKLKSKRNNQVTTLILLPIHFTQSSWRSFHYFLRQFVL